MSEKPISPLRRRMIEDMSVRKFGEKTQHDYIRHIENFAKFLGRSPDTATGEDLRLYQVHQTATGVQPPSVNSSAVALRFLFTVTLGCANLATQLTHVHYPRRLPRGDPHRREGLGAWTSKPAGAPPNFSASVASCSRRGRRRACRSRC